MRIGLLTTSFPRVEHDVAGTFVLGFARALAARGHTIEVLAPEPAQGAAPCHWPGVEVHWVPYVRPRRWARTFYGAGAPDNLRRDARAWFGLAPFAAALAVAAKRAAPRWDAMASHWALPSAYAAAFARQDQPHVAVLHSADVHLLGRLPARTRWATHLARGATTLAFVSDAHRERFLGWLPHEVRDEVAPRAHVQAMGVEMPATLDHDRATARRALGVERFMLLSMGRLVPVKGLVEAARALASRDDLEWCIAGAGPERDALERVARTSRARIRLLGEVHGADKETLFRAADVLVVPSRRLSSGRSEGVPTVIAEAMARGLPVVAATVGGIPEIVRHAGNGVLFDPEDPRTLLRAIDRVRDDATFRDTLVADARQDSVRWTWGHIAPRVESWLTPDARTARA